MTKSPEELGQELLQALSAQNSESATALIEEGADLNVRDQENNTPLHLAVKIGNPKLCRAMLNRGADAMAQNLEGYSVLDCAVFSNNADVLEELLASDKADLNKINGYGKSFLHTLLEFGSYDTIKFAMSRISGDRVDMNIVAKDRKTLAARMISRNSKTILKFFINELRFGKEYVDQKGYPLLHLAIFFNAKRCFDYLIEHEVDVNKEVARNRTTPMHLAAAVQNPEYCKKLLEKGANIDAKDSEGHSPLSLSIRHNTLPVFDVLIKSCASRQLPNNEGLSQIHLAAMYGNIAIARRLLQEGVHVNSVDRLGKTALHYAAFRRGSEKILSLLISNGANPELKDHEGNTAFDYAIKSSDYRVCRELIFVDGVNLGSIKKEYLPNLVYQMALRGDDEMEEKLIAQFGAASVETLVREAFDVQPLGDISLLEKIIRNNEKWPKRSEKALQLALKYNIKFNKFDGKETPLHVAAELLPARLMLLIIEKEGVDFLLQTEDGRKDTILHKAARSANREVYDLLVSKGADPHFVNGEGLSAEQCLLQSVLCFREGRNPEDVAVRTEYEINDMFLKSKIAFDSYGEVDPDDKYEICDFNFCGVRYTVLKDPQRLGFLLISPDSPYHKSRYEKTIFANLAVERLEADSSVESQGEQYWQIRAGGSNASILVYPGSDFSYPNSDEVRPLSEYQFLFLKQRLQNMLNLYKESLLHLDALAAGSDSKKIKEAKEFFLEKGIKPESNYGHKALHKCVTNNANYADRAVKVLSEIGVDANHSFNNIEPIVMAAARGNIGVCKALLDAGALPNSYDEDQENIPLITAIECGNFEAALYLISRGATCNLNNEKQAFLAGVTAIRQSDLSQLNQIIARYPEFISRHLSWEPKDGLLHQAVKYRASDEMLAFLVEKNVDLEALNGSGKTALALACHFGNLSAVSFLIRNGANANWRSQEGDSILHIATSAPVPARLQIIREITSVSSADINITNSRGKTAFQLLTSLKDKNYEVGCVLLDKKAAFKKENIEEAPFIAVWAAKNGNLELLEEILDSHASALKKMDSNFKKALLSAAASSNKHEIIESVAKFSSEKSFISIISRSCTAEVLHNFLSRTSSKDLDLAALVNFSDKETPPAIYSAILSAIKPEGVDKEDCESEALKKLTILLDNGADANLRCDGNRTLLNLAAKEGAANVVRYLLDRNLAVDGDDAQKFASPLHEAVNRFFGEYEDLSPERRDGFRKVIETLVKEGADINAVGPDGNSPYSIATKHKNVDQSVFDCFVTLQRASSTLRIPIEADSPKPSPESASASPRSIKSLDSTRTQS